MNAAQDGDIIDLPAPTYNMVGSANIQHSFTLRCLYPSPVLIAVHYLFRHGGGGSPYYRAGPAGVEFQGGWGWTVSNGTLTLDGSFRFNDTKGDKLHLLKHSFQSADISPLQSSASIPTLL
jgi:hypothetical protein